VFLRNKDDIVIKILSILLLMTSMVWANISGTVFRDLPVNGTTLNSYGVKDSNELGVAGITVTAFPENISTVTAADGSWSLGTTVDSRIEFSNIPSYLKESIDGGSKNSSVQFASNGSSVNFALHDPNDFSATENPMVINSTWLKGSMNGSDPALYRFAYTDNGQNSGDSGFQGNYPAPAAEIVANFGDIGTTWGIAYQKKLQRIFVATVVKRLGHMANDVGYIYGKHQVKYTK